jgi:hypothetical protein
VGVVGVGLKVSFEELRKGVILLWWAGRVLLKLLGIVGYFIGSFFPLVVFFLVPFGFLSFLFGGGLALAARFKKDGGLDYSMLAIAFPLECALVPKYFG